MTSPHIADASGGAGWYRDPWSVAAWRWWDGSAWTVHVSGAVGASDAAAARPRLPAWLSVPVLVCGILVALGVLAMAFLAPVAVVLGLVPLVLVVPALLWLDRVEPEPRSAKLHAFLWGATVAVVVSIVVNTVVAVIVGEQVATVISAPVVEEATKALAILWALRRRELDGIMDGIVYAGWAALGFAVVEDMTYFAGAGDAVVEVFVLRALLTPFAHPLFTVWTGMAIGRAVERGRPISSAWWGYLVAVLLHFAWNGSLALSESAGGAVVIVGALGFFALFVLGSILLYRARRHEQRRFLEWVPYLLHRHGLDAALAQQFVDWRVLLRTRRRLGPEDRRRFDALHAGLARLATLHANAATHGGEVDAVTEQRLAQRMRNGLHPA